MDFSRILRKSGIEHLVLNDDEKEDKDFILMRARKPGAVAVATNTAGRGTNIVLTAAALELGGLHVIIGFLPANLRVEVQAIGRCGRQGQRGSCKIIVAVSGEFARTVGVSVRDEPSVVYEKRTRLLERKCGERGFTTQEERRLFSALVKFFEMIDDLERQQKQMKVETGRGLCMLEVIVKLKQEWANFFSELPRLSLPDGESNEDGSKRTVCQFVGTSSVRDGVQRPSYQKPG
jgi:hypothetical protein